MSQRLLARLVPTGRALPVLRGPLKGARWLAGAAAGEGKGLSVVLGRAEASQLERAAALVRSARTCLDIGANVGLYTLLFARAGARVFAFEPSPRNIAWLYRTLEANALSTVTVIPWAMAGDDGFDSFETGDNCAVGHLAAGGRQPVAISSVDRFARRYGVAPDLMKIDVEGAESLVLAGARETITHHRPVILLSTHSGELRAACLQQLRTMGPALVEPLDHRDESSASEFCIRWSDPTSGSAA
jgi:FkbM family methyltransferase